MKSISFRSSFKEEIIEITDKINTVLKETGKKDGICLIYTPHTTAAITINENTDKTVRSDILKGLKYLNIESCSFLHPEGNSPAHIKSSIVGCSETVIIEDYKLQLGIWQGIFFCEFDGPRQRNIYIKII